MGNCSRRALSPLPKMISTVFICRVGKNHLQLLNRVENIVAKGEIACFEQLHVRKGYEA